MRGMENVIGKIAEDTESKFLGFLGNRETIEILDFFIKNNL